MKKRTAQVMCVLVCLLLAIPSHSQRFIFPPVSTDSNCFDGSDYILRSGIRITGVEIVDIYNDDGDSANTNNTFAYEIQFTYANIFDGTINSTGSFYDYTVSMYTDNPFAGGTITNTGGNVPLVTDTIGNMTLNNNPTYHGSASAMGFQTGLYTDQESIDIFGYDSLALMAHAPCLAVDVSAVPSVPLPIFITDFDAVFSENKVVLNWDTQMELDSKGFMIQKSSNGKNWADLEWIGTKALYGHSEVNLHYNAIDPEPVNGIRYYRLRHESLTGIITYSRVAVADAGFPEQSMTLFPSPAGKWLYLRSKVPIDRQPVFLIDATGRMIKIFEIEGTSGAFDLHDIDNGMYLLRLHEKMFKVMVQ